MSEVFMLESFKIFVSVAERGSINSGAEACFITPPAAMKRINSLEDELGVRLFERSGRGVKLTPAGKSYLADAKTLLRWPNKPRQMRAGRPAAALLCGQAHLF